MSSQIDYGWRELDIVDLFNDWVVLQNAELTWVKLNV